MVDKKENLTDALANKLDIRDTLVNFISGMGTQRDKRSSTEFTHNALGMNYLGILYHNWMFGKVVDVPADDMTRKWRTINASLDTKQVEEYDKAQTDFKVQEKFNEVIKWARLFGGGGIVLGVNDGLGEPREPLNLESIGQGDLEYLEVYDRWDLLPYMAGTCRVVGKGLMPEYYQLPGGLVIHHSRVIRFDGYKLPKCEFERNQYWGGSICERVYDEVLNTKITTQSISSLIFEASIDVIGVSNLFERVMNKKSMAALLKRFELAALTKSINKALIIDKDQEEFKKSSTSFSGLPNMISEYLSVVAAAADIPATRMLGQSAKGFSATGDGDLETYYDMVSSKQETDLRPQLQQLDEVLARNTWGFMPDDWGFEFNSLWQTQPKEQAEINKLDSETDEKNKALGVVLPHHIAARLLAANIYPTMDAEWVEAVEKADELDIKNAAAGMDDMEGPDEDPEDMEDMEDPEGDVDE